MNWTVKLEDRGFKVGDCVVLKIGGPAMTIDSIHHTREATWYDCIWFDEQNTYHRAQVAPDNLCHITWVNTTQVNPVRSIK